MVPNAKLHHTWHNKPRTRTYDMMNTTRIKIKKKGVLLHIENQLVMTRSLIDHPHLFQTNESKIEPQMAFMSDC
jgi:hypothetical protein